MPSLASKVDAERKLEIIVAALDDKKALDVEVLSIEKQTLIADYFVVTHATSSVHLRGLAEGVTDAMEDQGDQRARQEGAIDANWILLDYGDVVVHLFLNEARKVYDLESLWRTTQAIREADQDDLSDEDAVEEDAAGDKDEVAPDGEDSAGANVG